MSWPALQAPLHIVAMMSCAARKSGLYAAHSRVEHHHGARGGKCSLVSVTNSDQ